MRLYTGDDFNYPELIRRRAVSDALLGVFDAIAPAASAALQALDAGEPARYDAILGPTVPLARKLFALADVPLQDRHRLPRLARRPSDAFRMVAGAQSARSLLHLADSFRLADAAGPAARPRRSPSTACGRLLALAGIGP